MSQSPPRVTLRLGIRRHSNRHAEFHAGIQRHAEERGWITVIDEFAYNILRG